MFCTVDQYRYSKICPNCLNRGQLDFLSCFFPSPGSLKNSSLPENPSPVNFNCGSLSNKRWNVLKNWKRCPVAVYSSTYCDLRDWESTSTYSFFMLCHEIGLIWAWVFCLLWSPKPALTLLVNTILIIYDHPYFETCLKRLRSNES